VSAQDSVSSADHCHRMEDTEEVFEDALDDIVEATEININALNNNKPAKSSSKSFKLKNKKHEKHDKQRESVQDISLEQGLAEAQEAIDLFFNNQFEESREIAQRHCDKSIYHALGFGTFHYLRAVMTFDQEHIEHASTVLTQSVATIDRFRRRTGGLVDTLGKMVRKQDYDSYTEMEVHAELVYAECLLLKAMLTVCEDETLVSFVKAGLKVRQCYLSFRSCWDILQTRDWVGKGDRHKNQFEGGVRLGVGTFNLIMSLLPPRITKLMEFIGFTGSREAGLGQLLTCYRDKTCLRQFLASIILLGYNLFLTHHTGQGASSDYKLVREILDSKLERYPKGAFFLFFQGRFSLVQGHCAEATEWYLKANGAQNEWPQFHHVACWEMVWSASYRCMWRESLGQATRLLDQSRWSPCLYSYLKAAYYCMLQAELTVAEVTDQEQLMAAVPGLKQRIAGKSLPMEKFAIRKAERWTKQGGRLTLPGLELVYLWNGFTILGQHYQMVEQFFVLIEQEMEVTEQRRGKAAAKEPFQLEDDCLLLLLKGMCLKYMTAPLAAEECMRKVISGGGQSQLKADKYLVPYATVELALLLIDSGDMAQAWNLLELAKNNYKDYSLQSRLHFRIHAAQNKIQSKEAKETGAKPSQDMEVIMPIKQRKGDMVRELESCTDSELKEMIPHI